MSIKAEILGLGRETAERLASILPPSAIDAIIAAQQKVEQSNLPSAVKVDEVENKLRDIAEVAQLFSDDEFLVQEEIRKAIREVNSEWNALVISEIYRDSPGNFMEKIMDTLNETDYFLRLSQYDSYYKRQLGGLDTPSGVQSKLTLEQQEYVRKPEFISWFGDWITAAKTGNYQNVSKLVDAETKEPQLVFHGTAPTAAFFRFNTKRTISPVIYVSNDFEYAKWYADNEQKRGDRQAQKGGRQYVYQMFCNMKNPLDFRMFKLQTFTGDEVADIINVFTGYRPQNLHAKDPRTGKQIDKTQLIWYFRFNPELITEVKKRTSFDGIIFLGYNPSFVNNGVPIPEDEILVFDNYELKFAHASFFSEFVQDIRFEKGGQI